MLRFWSSKIVVRENFIIVNKNAFNDDLSLYDCKYKEKEDFK